MKKIFILTCSLLLVSCASKPTVHSSVTHENIKVGKSYQVAGKWYHPSPNAKYDKVGIASWYGPNFHGKKTANGEYFNKEALTAAHKTLPLPSIVKVTNLSNNRSILVRVNDRGPFVDDRIIDLSSKAATVLGFKNKGVEKVRVQYMEKETNQFIADLKNNNLHNNDIWLAEHSSNNAKYAKEKLLVAKNNLETPENNIDANHISEEISHNEIKINPKSKESLLFVQAGTFSVKDNAYNMVKQLAHLGSTVVIPINVNNNTWYKVRFGPFENNKDAEHIHKQLLSLGNRDAIIISDNIEYLN